MIGGSSHAPSQSLSSTQLLDSCAAALLGFSEPTPSALSTLPTPCSVASALSRRAPGRVGMLCPIEPSDNPLHNCAPDLICVPLPDVRGS